MRGLVVSATEPDCNDPSSIPQMAEHTVINFFDVVNPLLTTNDGRGRKPN